MSIRDTGNTSDTASITAEEVYERIRTAKQSRRKPLPFDRHWEARNAPPDKHFVLASNAFERSLLKFVALHEGKSMTALARELLREAAMRRVLDL